jgi:hypothetical protein
VDGSVVVGIKERSRHPEFLFQHGIIAGEVQSDSLLGRKGRSQGDWFVLDIEDWMKANPASEIMNCEAECDRSD